MNASTDDSCSQSLCDFLTVSATMAKTSYLPKIMIKTRSDSLPIEMPKLCSKIVPWCDLRWSTVTVIGQTDDPENDNSLSTEWLAKAVEIDATIIDFPGPDFTVHIRTSDNYRCTVIRLNTYLYDTIFVYDRMYQPVPFAETLAKRRELEKFNFLQRSMGLHLESYYREVRSSIRGMRTRLLRTYGPYVLEQHLSRELHDAKLAHALDDTAVSRHMLQQISNDLQQITSDRHDVEDIIKTFVRRQILTTVSNEDIAGTYWIVPLFMHMVLGHDLPDGFIRLGFMVGTAHLVYVVDMDQIMSNIAERIAWEDNEIGYDVVCDYDYADYDDLMDHRQERLPKGSKHTKSHTSFRVRGSKSVTVQEHQAIGAAPRTYVPQSIPSSDAIPRDRQMLKTHPKSNPRCFKPKEIARRMTAKTHML